jgi:hypothetical protein
VEVVAVLSHGPAEPDGVIDPPELEPPAIEPPRPVLVPFCFWLPRTAGSSHPLDPPDPTALRSAIRAHLTELGWADAQPLRWAITAVDPLRGLQLEGVGMRQVPAAREQR